MPSLSVFRVSSSSSASSCSAPTSYLEARAHRGLGCSKHSPALLGGRRDEGDPPGLPREQLRSQLSVYIHSDSERPGPTGVMCFLFKGRCRRPQLVCLPACRPATFVRSGLTDAKRPAMQAESAPADRDAPPAESGVIFPRERASSGGTTSRLRSGQSRRRRAAAGWARVCHPAAPTAGRSVRREAARATARCRAQSAGARRAHAPSVMAVTSCSRRAECRPTVRARARAPSPTLDASP